MSKEWICDPNEKFETLESAYFQLDDIVKDLRAVEDAQEIAEVLVDMMTELEERMEQARIDCESEYAEMIREQERDYWKEAI